jgi:hypothetical protein
MVMANPLAPIGRVVSEFFGMDQGVEQVKGERRRERETGEGFKHGKTSQVVAGGRIGGGQREERECGDEKDDVEHGWAPDGSKPCCARAGRERSMRLCGPVHKRSVKRGLDMEGSVDGRGGPRLKPVEAPKGVQPMAVV